MLSSVLLVVFRYLDDISKWTASQVCQRWRQLLDAEISQSEWKHFISRRWPLFQPQFKVQCWKDIYTQLYVTFFVCFLFFCYLAVNMLNI
jgi:hypothetical protein